MDGLTHADYIADVMHFRSVIAICVVGLALLQPLNAALARPARDNNGVQQPQQTPDSGHDRRATTTFTPASAARAIQRMHGGRILAVQADGAGYRVKMLKDGEVRIYQVDP